jgi:putative ABC transport system substrate-binding protein
MERLAAARLPAIYQWPEYAAERALIAYGPRQSLISRLLAQQIDHLLRGTPVAAVPVIQPSKYDLVINAHTAHELDLSIPPSLLARADEVID